MMRHVIWRQRAIRFTLTSVVGFYGFLFCLFGFSIAQGLPPSPRQPTTTPNFPNPQTGGSSNAQVNTCPCKSPIPSKATATGSCSVAQDDGTFCSIMFNLSQRSAALAQSPLFAKQSMDLKISADPQGFATLLSRMEANRWSAPIGELGASVQAVAAVAAFEIRENPNAQVMLRDVVELFSNLADGPVNERKAPVVRIVQRFGSPALTEVLRDRATSAGGRVFELGASAGCVAVESGAFRFAIRARGEATACDQSR
jgi:hypothetical protein